MVVPASTMGVERQSTCRTMVLGFSCSDVERAGKAHDDGQCMYGVGDIRW